MSRIRRIVHPTDFSRASGAAFRKALDLAKTSKAELLVVHVLAPTVPMVGDGYVSPEVYEDLVASARAYGKKNLDALVAKAKKAGVRAKSLLLEGVPHEQIARTARKQRLLNRVLLRQQSRRGSTSVLLRPVFVIGVLSLAGATAAATIGRRAWSDRNIRATSTARPESSAPAAPLKRARPARTAPVDEAPAVESAPVALACTRLLTTDT